MSSIRFIISIFIAITGFNFVYAADGEKIYRKCKACHVADTEQNKIGPHLKGILGRQVGAVEGYKYSKAMLSREFKWTEAELDAYLTKPKAHTPGTKMVFPGLRKSEDRAALIEYLKQVTN